MLPWIDQAVSQLASGSWCHLPQVIDVETVSLCNQWIDEQAKRGNFTSAGIGRGEGFQQNHQIRGDKILWLNDNDHIEQLQPLISCINLVMETLNRELFTGLQSFEGHFALYPAGTYYKRHLDSFRDDDSRSITFILYLNRQWRQEDGGQLLLDLNDGHQMKIPPLSGTVVMFDSRKFAHEVLPATVERRSFTGWFKVQKLSSSR